MFGKSKWFKPVAGGLGLVPLTLHGWLYFFTWTVIALAPTAALLGSYKRFEAGVWMLAVVTMLIRDTRQIVREKRCEDLFVIDGKTEVTKIKTDNFDLELRQ